MCGRFALFATMEQIVHHFHLKDKFIMEPRYNIAPTQTIPIILSFNQPIAFSRWAFIPPWAKGEEGKLPDGYINARRETLLEKATFKNAFKKQRCIIPASGYYEWKTLGGKKQPFFITLKDQPLIGLAGIWSSWRHTAWEDFHTCAILTTQSTGEMARIHDRMPVILSPDNYENWLDHNSKTNKPETLLEQQNLFDFQIYPVSPQVNVPGFDNPVCIKPL